MSLNKKFLNKTAGVDGGIFGVVTYTGNSSDQSITGVGFKPDLVWIKERDDGVENHNWIDSTRGTGNILSSNLYDKQFASGRFTSFDTDGFTLSNNNESNDSGVAYVAWCWRANGGETSSNEDGDFTSTVQVNETLGFSIVKYTGGAINSTIGHGLGAVPDFIVVKNMDVDGQGWATQSPVTGGADYHCMLNTNQEAKNNVDWIWNDTEPTSSVFTVGANSITNGSGEDHIAYCFVSKAGYSKIGGYTGTGSVGNAQAIGFQPDFIILKRYNLTDNWVIIDSVRGEDKYLLADTDGDEQSLDILDITSTGWTFKGSSMNNSSDSFIYMAFKIATE